MTKKDYVAIAAALKHAGGIETPTSIRELAQRLATIFQDDNERFDRQRFLTACGVV